MMDLIRQSFQRLFPEKELNYQTELEYNCRLKAFNANIYLHHHRIKVNLNLQWKDIDNEIKIGLIQNLLLKIFRFKRTTANIDLYNNFIKNIPSLTIKDLIDPVLEASFDRVNQQFFDLALEKPNLTWGPTAFRKLAHYNFHNDSITVSETFRDAPPPILDYIMYHEMLHKHHKFNHKNGRSVYHSKQFKTDEAKYPGYKQMEKEIELIIKEKRVGQRSEWWRFF